MESTDMAEPADPLGSDVGGERERGESEGGEAGTGVRAARAARRAKTSTEEGDGGTKSRWGSGQRGGIRAGKRAAPISRADCKSGRGGGVGVRTAPQFQAES